MEKLMREIKFRAWQKTFEMMADVKSIDLYYSLVMLDAVTPDGLPPRYFLDGVELMQYTGLKDKNGKEIYEGDVVQIELSTVKDLKGTLEYNIYNLPVEFKEGEFRACADDWMVFGNLGCFNKECEVIGNIYENKDLIK